MRTLPGTGESGQQRPAAHDIPGPAGRARDNLLAERGRWPLWVPVLLGAGIGAYFWSPSEPPAWLGPAAVLTFLLTAWSLRRAPGLTLALLALLAVAAGFALAQLRTQLVAAPVLERAWGPAELTAEVLASEPRTRGFRLHLRPLAMQGLAEDALPARLRVTVAGMAAAPLPGSRLRLRASLRPPSPPALPGAFDFARQAWFQRLGGIGFAYGKADILAPPQSSGASAAWARWWAGLRQTVAERIAARIDGQAGAVAVALITGQRGGISEAVRADMRAAGLAHLLAISGLHMGLAAGCLFFFLRAGLALVPGLALHQPIKKWAAVAAVAGAFVYLNLVGTSIPAQRAFLMVAVVLLAVLLDRRALSLRLVAWAAAVILVTAPESLMSASFQMSFAAVTALIAAYEAWEGRRSRRRAARGPGVKLIAYFAGVAATSVIAILATGPFAAFHFQRLALYGLLANLVAVPLTAFWIMPWAVLALLLMPFGGEALGLVPMSWGIQLLLGLAGTVAAWPAASLQVPPMPDWGLGLAVLGGLWLCLWQRPWRCLGLALVLAGALSPLSFEPPSLLVSGDGRQAGLRDPEGTLWVAWPRGSRFVLDSWARQSFATQTLAWPGLGEGTAAGLNCDPLGCLYREKGSTLAVLRDPRGAADDCRLAEVLVSLEPLRRQPCRGPLVVIDRFDLWRQGAQAVWLGPGGPVVRTVAGQQGARPWSPYPARNTWRKR
ncbi:ComEC/Rec2 family competence protein [Pelagibius sp. CAU 1746]|uniref:ComEC/Rec2 family competence protein n=1 Tax=Pelagibius sp. CAU 1746 TaxID=3140370 RepID=UPI00325A49CB